MWLTSHNCDWCCMHGALQRVESLEHQWWCFSAQVSGPGVACTCVYVGRAEGFLLPDRFGVVSVSL